MDSYEHLNWVQGSKKALRDKLYSSENTQGRVILVGQYFRYIGWWLSVNKSALVGSLSSAKDRLLYANAYLVQYS